MEEGGNVYCTQISHTSFFFVFFYYSVCILILHIEFAKQTIELSEVVYKATNCTAVVSEFWFVTAYI